MQNGSLVYAGIYSGTAGTVSASLNGTAGLTMSGPGTLVLTGSNGYSGETTVSAGTLQIGNGGSGESLASPTISDGSTLVFDHADAMTYAGAISGNGQVVKLGTGLLTLSGAGGFSGTFTIGSASAQCRRRIAPRNQSRGKRRRHPPQRRRPGRRQRVYLRQRAQYVAAGHRLRPGGHHRQLRLAGKQRRGRQRNRPAQFDDHRRHTATGLPDRGQQQRQHHLRRHIWSYDASSYITGGTINNGDYLLSSAGTLVKVGSGTLTMSDAGGNDCNSWEGSRIYQGLYNLNLLGGEVIYSNDSLLPGFRNPTTLGTPGAITFNGGMLGLNFTETIPVNLQGITKEIQGANFNGGLDIVQAALTLPLSVNLTGTGSFTKAGPGIGEAARPR